MIRYRCTSLFGREFVSFFGGRMFVQVMSPEKRTPYISQPANSSRSLLPACTRCVCPSISGRADHRLYVAEEDSSRALSPADQDRSGVSEAVGDPRNHTRWSDIEDFLEMCFTGSVQRAQLNCGLYSHVCGKEAIVSYGYVLNRGQHCCERHDIINYV